MTEQEMQTVWRGPLRSLTPEQLTPYAHHALLTCGGVDDFKHFLPRIFELLPDNPGFGCEPELLMDRMNFTAHWREWPECEKRAITDWLSASWDVMLLEETRRGARCGRWLGLLAHATQSLSPWIEKWDDAMRSNTIALDNFAWFVCEHESGIPRAQLHDYWDSFPELQRALIDWLVRKDHPDLLDDARLAALDDPSAEHLERAASILRAAYPS